MAKNGWIRIISGGLPRQSQDVLVSDTRDVEPAHYNYDLLEFEGMILLTDDNITHWQPLPEPPKY